MSRRSKSSMSKKTKITIGAAVAIFVVAGGGLMMWQQSKSSVKSEVSYNTVNVTEGTISSSTLLIVLSGISSKFIISVVLLLSIALTLPIVKIAKIKHEIIIIFLNFIISTCSLDNIIILLTSYL